MVRKILIVDDDKILLRIISKNFKKYEDTFTVLTARNGLEAIEQLTSHIVSVVVTDLEMPEMDGYALLADISENYPDIPAIILTGTSLIQSKRETLQRAYAGFVQKPPVFEDLLDQILVILKKQSEGGVLKSFSLDAFVQIVGMGQKTCTLRIVNKTRNDEGLLFFMEGELLDARTSKISGKKAAYEILSWDDIVVEIQNDCLVKKRQITEDLSFVVMEALRRKDELAEGNPVAEESPTNIVDEKIHIAETYRSHGLYKEAVKIYRDVLAMVGELDPADRSAILGRIHSFKKELESLKDIQETETDFGINMIEAYLASGLNAEAESMFKSIAATVKKNEMDAATLDRLKKVSGKLKALKEKA